MATSCARVIASSRLVLYPDQCIELARSQFYLDLPSGSTEEQTEFSASLVDPFPFLSRRFYLAKRFSLRSRVRCYVRHRQFEADRRTGKYFDAIYGGRGGIELWRRSIDDLDLSVHLEQSVERDRNEGELSAVLRVCGAMASVVSFSYVPATLIGVSSGVDETAVLIGRSQTILGSAHGMFNELLPNESARMFTLAALSGVALADGFGRVGAVGETEQVGFDERYGEGFRNAYSNVWTSFVSPDRIGGIYTFDATFPPPSSAPIHAKNRSRQRRRRRGWESIRESSRAGLAKYASFPGA